MIEKMLVTTWDDYLALFAPTSRDVYFTEDYVRLYEDDEQQAVCFVYQENDRILLFPFLRRAFMWKNKQYFDFETAYGYGGPIINIDDKGFARRALLQLVEYCIENDYVAGFTRFHPILNNQEICKDMFSVIPDRQTVAIDLNGSEEYIWKNEIHTKNRNVIKKGEKAGLMFVADYDYDYLNDFIHLYNSTMDKLRAADFYYFDNDYYKQLVKKIPNSFLGVVKQDNKVISAAIFFKSALYGHYHLSGSDKSKLSLSPNNFMLWEAAKEFKRLGCQWFHLGGGTTSSSEDSLFCFKRRFSKNTYTFNIGKFIFNKLVYEALCDDWEVRNPCKVEQYKYFLMKYKL